MTEDFLHYVWKHRLFNSNQLFTSTGLPLNILSAGVHNHNGGPDFLQARVRIGEHTWVGNVEIHINASDWKKHGHHSDPFYSTVVLHVVFADDMSIHLNQPGDLPVFVMSPYLHDTQWQRYQQWMQYGKEIPCKQQLPLVEPIVWTGFRDALIVERLEQKSQWALRQLKQTRGDWNEVFYRLLARYFGGKVNGEAMEQLAERIPYQLVLRLRSDPFQLMALFYGESGLLNSTHTDAYAAALWKEYTFLKTKYQLPDSIQMNWQFFGLRPPGYPTIRLGQLVDLLSRSDGLLQEVLELADLSDLRSTVFCVAPDYWNTHTLFDRQRSKPIESKSGISPGNDFIDGLIINVIAVNLFAYGRHIDDAFCMQRALLLLELLEVEDNKIIRMWKSLGIGAKHAGDAQAMIQLYNRYCNEKRCLECRIGVDILKSS
jgi:hypothetical protein